MGGSQEDRRAELYRNLIRHEAKIGGILFGLVPEGGRREFFCLDARTWVWHEEWIDENGQYRFFAFLDLYAVKDNPKPIGKTSNFITSLFLIAIS